MSKKSERKAAALLIQHLGAEVVEWDEKAGSSFRDEPSRPVAAEVSSTDHGKVKAKAKAKGSKIETPHLFDDDGMRMLRGWKAPNARGEAEERVKAEELRKKGREVARVTRQEQGMPETRDVEL